MIPFARTSLPFLLLQRHSVRVLYTHKTTEKTLSLHESHSFLRSLPQLHENAMAWLRSRLAKTLPKTCWTESVEDYHKRRKAACTYINANYDVEGLCQDLPHRLQILVDNEGDRICRPGAIFF